MLYMFKLQAVYWLLISCKSDAFSLLNCLLSLCNVIKMAFGFIAETSLLQLGGDGENHIRVGKLNLVDLAGSERQGKTGAEVCLDIKPTNICFEM